VIVRILGEGQYRLDDDAFAHADSADDRLQAAVDAGDAAAFTSALAALVSAIRDHGTPVPDDELVGSDAIVPADDTTLEEARSLLSGEGLIPD
jgi:hypothetical protein